MAAASISATMTWWTTRCEPGVEGGLTVNFTMSAFTAARELATASPLSLWVWIPTVT